MLKPILTSLVLFTATAATVHAEDLKTVETKVDAALAAYNAGDAKKFFTDFSKSMEALATPQVFDALYTQGSKKLYGNYVSRELIKGESVTEGDQWLLVYKAKCTQSDQVKLAINVQKEGNEYRFVQLQFMGL